MSDDFYVKHTDSSLHHHFRIVARFTIGNLEVPVYPGKLPNRFHRLMQRWILGIKWTVA